MPNPTASCRRDFLKMTGLAVASVCVSTGSRSFGQGASPAGNALAVRKDVAKLPVNDSIIETYRKAVTAMQALPENDPRSWKNQAGIHLNKCPHGNWFFLPWHRAYILYFEKICREVTGAPDFTLPYWNWTTDPQMPAAFWGDHNSLMHPRSIGPNDTADAEFVGQQVIDRILGKKDFESFASYKSTKQRDGVGGGTAEFEGRPHNYIHGTFIGADMATFLSPLDPIFWLHHANIDRIWARWNGLGGANSKDPVWTNYRFAGDFVDEKGAAQTRAVSELVSTYPLGYRYEDQAPTPPDAPNAPAPFVALPDLALTINQALLAKPDLAAAISFPLKGKWQENIQSVAAQSMNVPAPFIPGHSPTPSLESKEKVQLRISGLTPPKDKKTTLRVFINCPYLSASTPINDPHYVGSIAFFGDHGGHGGIASGEAPMAGEHAGGGMAFVLDLTSTLGALSRRKSVPTEDIKVQLLAVAHGEGGAASADEVHAEKFEITVESEAAPE